MIRTNALHTSQEGESLLKFLSKCETLVNSNTLEEDHYAAIISNLGRDIDFVGSITNSTLKQNINAQLNILSCIGCAHLNASNANSNQFKQMPPNKNCLHQDKACSPFQSFQHFLTINDIVQAGWQDLPVNCANAFQNPPKPIPLDKNINIYRVVPLGRSVAGNWWMSENPANITEWRSKYAVLKHWNEGYDIYELELPGKVNVWAGTAASQFVIEVDQKNVATAPGCILEGGGKQYWIGDQDLLRPLIQSSIKKISP